MERLKLAMFLSGLVAQDEEEDEIAMFPPRLEDEYELSERRAQHREACIAAVKRSGDYGAVTRHFARPATPDPRQADVSKRAWEKSVRQWRMDLKALASGGLASAGAAWADGPLRVPSVPPMYVDLPVSADGVPFAPAPNEPLRVPCPPERERRRRSRSPCGADEECDEEVWQRRSAHRLAGIAAVKRSADYISATADRGVRRPRTPDATDRKLSKRAWERAVQQWRKALKEVVQNLRTASVAAIVIVDDVPLP